MYQPHDTNIEDYAVIILLTHCLPLHGSSHFQDGQFLADIGGSIGLWLGVSVIAILEVMELVADVLVLSCFKCSKQRPSSASTLAKSSSTTIA